jgi:hypothetical protein
MMTTEVSAKDVVLADFLLSLARLEVEIHNRGELSPDEVQSLLRKWCALDPGLWVANKDNERTDYQLDNLTTRMATLLSLWASCEDIHLTQSDLSELILYKEKIAGIFLNSGYRGFAHLRSYLAVKQDNGELSVPQSKLILYFLFIPLDELDASYFQLAQKLPKDTYVILMLGWLNCREVTTAFGEQARQKMFSQSDVLAKVNANQSFITYVYNAWMHSAYSQGLGRLQLKKNINQMIVNFLHTQKLDQFQLRAKPATAKPLMLVIHERINRGHAMYRSYVPYFKHLADKFELVSMAEESLPQELEGEIFSRNIQVTDSTDLPAIIGSINELAPDIIYYPSLGMKQWTGFLCNLRLAPMQVMSCGHPDSSQSKVMDYLFYGPDLPFVRGECSEKIISIKNYRFHSAFHDDLKGLELSIAPRDDGKMHLAINCTVMKLSADFFACLELINKEFGDKVQFHFFHAGINFLALQTDVMIKRRIPLAKTYSGLPYGQFLQLLKSCHLSLSPFPFGNTNSIFDATVLGLPVVAIKGQRIAGYTDYLVLKEFGLEQQGMTDTQQEYLEKVRRLINDPVYYQTHRQAVAAAVQHYLLKKQDAQFDPSFAEAVYATYQLHQKGSKKRVFCWDGEQLQLS